jgi:S-formylglutathione hydrolase FrmB
MLLRGNFYSEVLSLYTGITVFVPDHYNDGEPYRVCYLFHGLHNDQNAWVDSTMLQVFARDYRTLFVLPAVGRSFYADMKHGYQYFTYVVEELPRVIGSVFNVSAKREDTAVIGCSMGGYGALKAALSRPGQYGFCGAIASACLFINENLEGLRKNTGYWLETGGPEARTLLTDFQAAFGEELVCAGSDEILKLAEKAAARTIRPRIYAACGTEDKLQKENLRFKEQIETLNLDYTYEAWTGAHDWYFFNDALKKALETWRS